MACARRAVDVQLHSIALRSRVRQAWPVRVEQPPCSLAAVWPAGCARGLIGSGGLPTNPAGDEQGGGDPVSRSVKLSRLEAALFAAQEPLSARRLAQVAALADGTEARTLLRKLNELYDAGGSAFRVEAVAGGYQLFTRWEFSRWLARRHRKPSEIQLSGAALETLTILAYRQPMLRAELEAIRGVQCGEMLRQLLDKGLVRMVGRDSSLGRPILYGTTREFLRFFGLKSLDDLPDAQRLREGGRARGAQSAARARGPAC